MILVEMLCKRQPWPDLTSDGLWGIELSSGCSWITDQDSYVSTVVAAVSVSRPTLVLCTTNPQRPMAVCMIRSNFQGPSLGDLLLRTVLSQLAMDVICARMESVPLCAHGLAMAGLVHRACFVQGACWIISQTD